MSSVSKSNYVTKYNTIIKPKIIIILETQHASPCMCQLHPQREEAGAFIILEFGLGKGHLAHNFAGTETPSFATAYTLMCAFA